jgi:ABC-type transport system substrate-binding protein
VTTDVQSWGEFSSNAESRAVEYATGSFTFLGMNPANEYLADYGVRAALAHAINKRRLFEEVLLSHGALTDTCMNPKWWVYNDDVTKYDYDPPRAAAMLEERQLQPSGMTLQLLVNNDNKIKLRAAELIAEAFRDLGVNASVAAAEWESFTALIAAGAYDLYLGEINYSPEINPEYLLREHETFAPLLDNLQRQTTDEGRKAAYDDLQREYAGFLPSIPLYFETEALLYHGKLNGNMKPLRNNMFHNAYEWYVTELSQNAAAGW